MTVMGEVCVCVVYSTHSVSEGVSIVCDTVVSEACEAHTQF